MGQQDYWFALLRNGGREIADMVVAWMSREEANAEVEAYQVWDKNLTKTNRWEMVRFRRTTRESYYKDTEALLIEYHWVWEDFQEQTVESVETWP